MSPPKMPLIVRLVLMLAVAARLGSAMMPWDMVEEKLEFGQLRSIIEQNSEPNRDDLDKCLSIWQKLSAKVLGVDETDPSIARSEASASILDSVLGWLHEAELGDEPEHELERIYKILHDCSELIEDSQRDATKSMSSSGQEVEYRDGVSARTQMVDLLESSWLDLCERKQQVSRQMHDLGSQLDTEQIERSAMACRDMFSEHFDQLRHGPSDSHPGESSGTKNEQGRELESDVESELAKCERELMELDNNAYCAESELRSELSKVRQARAACEQELRYVNAATLESSRRFNQRVADQFKL